MKVIDYKLLVYSTGSTMSVAVLENLQNGYTLYGSPYSKDGYHAQAMVKYDETPKLNLTEEQVQDHWDDLNFTL